MTASHKERLSVVTTTIVFSQLTSEDNKRHEDERTTWARELAHLVDEYIRCALCAKVNTLLGSASFTHLQIARLAKGQLGDNVECEFLVHGIRVDVAISVTRLQQTLTQHIHAVVYVRSDLRSAYSVLANVIHSEK